MFYRMLAVEHGAERQCLSRNLDRQALMARLLLIVPPLEMCAAHEARCEKDPAR